MEYNSFGMLRGRERQIDKLLEEIKPASYDIPEEFLKSLAGNIKPEIIKIIRKEVKEKGPVAALASLIKSDPEL